VDDAGVASVLSACAALTVLELSECRQLVHVAVAHDGFRILSVRSCSSSRTPATKVDVECRRAPAMVMLVLYVTNGTGARSTAWRVAAAASSASSSCSSHRLYSLHALEHGWRFQGLNKIVLLFKTPWREPDASVASLLAAAPQVRELRVEAYSDLPVPPPNKQAIQWPNRCSPRNLESIAIVGGFSGEPELMELAYFLLMRSPAMRTLTIDTHRRHAGATTQEPSGVLWTNLAPKIGQQHTEKKMATK
jgi:hypothetical protein